MPFLKVLWNPDRFGEEQMVFIRDGLAEATGPALMGADPDHIVNARMVDAHLIATGPLDRVRSDLFITVFARHEPQRALAAANIVAQLAEVAVRLSGLADPVVELILTSHTSSHDYSLME